MNGYQNNLTNNSVELPTWESVRQWCDEHGTLPPTFVEQVNSGMFPKDAFSLGQLASKFWMLEHLQVIGMPQHKTCVILGCWIGSIVPLLYRDHTLERIYGLDMDPVAISKAEVFNRRFLTDWKFKGVVQDISLLDTSDMQFETAGELIQISPEIVINTSCEHMSTDWFESASNKQLIIMQTNDSTDFDGHINTCDSLEHMQDKYPLSNTLMSGSLKTPVYTRFMQIGYK